MPLSWLDTYDRSHLPNDVEALKDIIDGLVVPLKRLHTEYGVLRTEYEALKEQVELLRHGKFGKKSEKSKVQHSWKPEKKTPKKHPGRQALPEHLERVREEYDLSEEEKVCPLCQEIMEKIREIATEQLDVVPITLQAKQHVRFVYACRKCYGGIKCASRPPQALEKGLPSPRLLAHVMASKFADHTPLYRQEQWFARQGCPVTRSTMWGWENKAASELQPLADCLIAEVQARDHIFGDDTTMPTLAPGLGRTQTGRFWIYASPRTKDKAEIIVYQYTANRKGEHPQTFLKNSKGFFQSDAYSGFNKLLQNKQKQVAKTNEGPTLTSVGCWGHVRRKFVEVLLIDPLSVAKEVIEMIQELYQVEKQAKEDGFTPAQRKKLRNKKSKPILKRIHKWLLYHESRASPKGGLGKAIGYARNCWSTLETFLEDGRLEIDNNRSERGIKPIVIGRKNYMFMGGPRGGEAAATLYTLIETCKANKVDPYHYLADVLERIPTHPNKRIQELLPQNWVPAQALMYKTLEHTPAPQLAA